MMFPIEHRGLESEAIVKSEYAQKAQQELLGVQETAINEIYSSLNRWRFGSPQDTITVTLPVGFDLSAHMETLRQEMMGSRGASAATEVGEDLQKQEAAVQQEVQQEVEVQVQQETEQEEHIIKQIASEN